MGGLLRFGGKPADGLRRSRGGDPVQPSGRSYPGEQRVRGRPSAERRHCDGTEKVNRRNGKNDCDICVLSHTEPLKKRSCWIPVHCAESLGWCGNEQTSLRKTPQARFRIHVPHARPGRGGAWRITRPKQTRVRPLPAVKTTSASARARFREKRYTVPAGSL